MSLCDGKASVDELEGQDIENFPVTVFPFPTTVVVPPGIDGLAEYVSAALKVYLSGGSVSVAVMVIVDEGPTVAVWVMVEHPPVELQTFNATFRSTLRLLGLDTVMV